MQEEYTVVAQGDVNAVMDLEATSLLVGGKWNVWTTQGRQVLSEAWCRRDHVLTRSFVRHVCAAD
jgi:hypothetical protein